MSLFKKLGDALNKIDYHISSTPEVVGRRFEDHVEKLFDQKYFLLTEKTHSFDTNKQRYVESSLNPDLIWKYKPTGEQFAVECKYRTAASIDNRGRLNIASQEQLNRHKAFSEQKKMPVFMVIGLGLEEEEHDDRDLPYVEKYMSCIPINELRYTAIYDSVFSKYERPYNKPFFWKNGKLF